MMSANDPVDSFFNSIKLEKEMLSPLEVSIGLAAKFGHCWAGPQNEGHGVQLAAQVSEGWKSQICVKKKVGDEKKKGMSSSGNRSKEKALTKEDVSYTNYLQFAVNWSLFVNGFLQSLQTPFKSGKKQLKKMDAEDCSCSCWKSNVSWELKQTEFNGQSVVKIFRDKDVKKKEINHVSLECLIGFISDRFTPNLQNFDEGLQGNDCNGERTSLLPPPSHFNHLKVFPSILEGHQVYVNRFLRNLRFAKVGGMPSSIVEVSPSAQQEGDGSATVENREEMGRRSTAVAVPPPVESAAGSVLKSALAGGLSCALSCALMHPVDTIKTQVQASTMTFLEIISKLPQIGARGLYRGSIPAILGQFSSHGLRTGISEASKLVLINVAPTLPDFQVESISSFCSTFLGTAARIPCEVLKQKLQAGLFENVGEALVGIWSQDGVRGFFRGTGATLCREVPFYVAGTGLYAESKKIVQQLLGRELEAWETVAVGAITGGLTAVVTTPLDVIKTRMMTAQGQSVSTTLLILSILRQEGPLAFYKGAMPRFFWVAPLGAINFAGYELLRKAMD